MDVEEQVRKFQDFIEKNYKSELAESIRKGGKVLEVDFSDLSKFNPELAELILEDPENLIKAFELAVEQFDFSKDIKNFRIRLKNLPKTQKILISEVRSKHINKIFIIEGVVRQKSSVRPEATSAKFECPQCSSIISVLQLDSIFKEPSKCLKKGTKVLTREGYVNIEDIKDKLLCVDYEGNLIDSEAELIYSGKKEGYRLNNEIECSAEHLWFVMREGKCRFLETKHLNMNDILLKIYDKKLYNMFKGFRSSSKNIFKEGQGGVQTSIFREENMLQGMSKKTFFQSTNRQEKNRDRRRKDSEPLHKRGKVYEGYIINNEGKQEININKIKVTKNKNKNIKGTKKDRHQERKNEGNQVWETKSLLQAWKEMWRSILQEDCKRERNQPLHFLQVQRKFSSSSQRPRPPKSSYNKLSDSLQFMPYKISRIDKLYKKVDMYDLKVPNYNNFILSNGVISHNCGCGRKGKFILISKELIDAQGIVLEESTESLKDNQQPQRINVLLKDDLVSPLAGRKTPPGSKIRVIGIIHESPIISRQGGKLKKFDLIVDANNIEPLSESFYDLKISKEEKKEILTLSERPDVFNVFIESIAPSIYGYEEIKEAILMQLFGGVRKVRSDKVVSRGDFHILLVGDPGAGKSALIRRINDVAPKGRYVSGKGASGVGLTASVVKDEFLRGFALEAGAIVLSSDGICCIDENQMLLSNKGLVKIKDVDEGDILISYDKGFKHNKVKRKIDNGRKEVIDILLYSGDIISCTEDHKILTNSGWVQSSDLTTNHYIKIPTRTPILSNKEEHELGFLFGFAMSDIWYNTSLRKGSKTCIKNSMSFCASVSNQERSNKVTELLKKHYKIKNINYSPTKEIECYINGKIAKFKPSGSFSFSDKRLHKGLKDMFEDNKLPLSSDSFYLGFLAGILSTDACIFHKQGKYGIKHEICITITRKRKKRKEGWNLNHMKLINSILHSFGILSVIREDKIIISSLKSYNLVYGLFSSLLVGKNKSKLYKVTPKIKIQSYDDLLDNDYHNWFKKIKFNTTKTVKLGLGSRIWRAIHKNRVTTTLMKTLKVHWEEITKELFVEPNKNYLLNKVISISNKRVSNVYDLTMEGEPNFFVCGGIVHNCIDEMDKMTEEDMSAMHEALENQTVSISKANIQATLIARTTVLAAANPRDGRFDPYDIVSKQIDMPSTLINRFDLIFPIKDLPEKERDTAMADHMLELHHAPDSKEGELSTEFIKKYVAYAKQNIKPQITKEAMKEIKAYYIKMRSMASEEGERIKAIPISPRQLDALVRMTEASAKVRLSHQATDEDAKRAIRLLEYCLMQVGFDKETGKIDIDRISTGVSASERNILHYVRDAIEELSSKMKVIPIEDLVDYLKVNNNITSKDRIEEVIEKLKRAGDIFEPRHGFITKI